MFQSFPKVPRLMRDCIVTEKLDGTNAQVWIVPKEDQQGLRADGSSKWTESLEWNVIARGVGNTAILAGSRKRFVTPSDDNFGFAKWVRDHADDLIKDLGPGRHYGEWWGLGIRRGYGLSEKKFSLFNTRRWYGTNGVPGVCDCVPVLYVGPFSTCDINDTLHRLYTTGSVAAPGFKRPEGIMVWHEAARQLFKYTLDGDGYKGA